jgi:hypothetical protein
MKFSLQHNGNGKKHLIPIGTESSKEICGTSGVLLFTHTSDIELTNGAFYEIDPFAKTKTVVKSPVLELEYCKKCLKKAQKILKN